MNPSNMLTIVEGNLQKEKSHIIFVGGTNNKRKVASISKRGKGKKQVKIALVRKGHSKRKSRKYLHDKA